jgi:hypothetical protein
MGKRTTVAVAALLMAVAHPSPITAMVRSICDPWVGHTGKSSNATSIDSFWGLPCRDRSRTLARITAEPPFCVQQLLPMLRGRIIV